MSKLQFLTDADLDTVVRLPDDHRKSLRHLDQSDLKALALQMDRAGAEAYFALARRMTETETFQEALKAGKFPHARYVNPVVPLFHEPTIPPTGGAA